MAGYNEGMYKDRRLSDSELLLGAVFVVCVFVGVGLVGSESSGRTAMTRAQVATTGAIPTPGATTPTVSAGSTGGTQTTQNAGAPAPAQRYEDCLEQKVAQGSMSGRPEYVSKDNCIYHVSARALGQVDLKPVFKENTKCQVHMSMPFGSAPCVQSCKATLSATIALCGGGFDTMYYQSAQAFTVTNATLPTEGAVSQVGAQTAGNISPSPTNTSGAQTKSGLSYYSPYGPDPSNPGSTPWGYDPWQQNAGTPGAAGTALQDTVAKSGTSNFSPYYKEGDTAGNFGDVSKWYQTDATALSGGTAGAPSSNTNQFRIAGDDSTWGDINEYDQFKTSGDDPTWGDAVSDSNTGEFTPVESTNVRGTSDDYALPAGEDALRPNSWEACLKDPSTCADAGIAPPAVAKPAETDPSLDYGAEGMDDTYKVNTYKWDEKATAPGASGWSYTDSSGNRTFGTLQVDGEKGSGGYYTGFQPVGSDKVEWTYVTKPVAPAPIPPPLSGTPSQQPSVGSPAAPTPFWPNAETCGSFLSWAGWTPKCYGWNATSLDRAPT